MATHLIFGAGLIGCYLGGALQHKQEKVHLVARAQIRAKLAKGMQLTDFEDNHVQLPPPSFVDPASAENIPNYDYLWLTVKCTGVKSTLTDLTRFVSANTVILCCQNGLGSSDLVQATFPHNKVLRVMVPFNVIQEEAGHFHRGSAGELAIEAAHDWHPQALVQSIQSELLPVISCDNMQALLWAKLQLNLGNSVNALADVPVKEMLLKRGYRNVIAAMMHELLLVCARANIDLPKVTKVKAAFIPWVLRLPTFLFKRVANAMLAIDPKVRTSMWWDISQGKATEIDYLNGALVAEGQRLGIDCPVNQKVIFLIKSLEQVAAKNASIQSESTGKSNLARPRYSADELVKAVLTEWKD